MHGNQVKIIQIIFHPDIYILSMLNIEKEANVLVGYVAGMINFWTNYILSPVVYYFFT